MTLHVGDTIAGVQIHVRELLRVATLLVDVRIAQSNAILAGCTELVDSCELLHALKPDAQQGTATAPQGPGEAAAEYGSQVPFFADTRTSTGKRKAARRRRRRRRAFERAIQTRVMSCKKNFQAYRETFEAMLRVYLAELRQTLDEQESSFMGAGWSLEAWTKAFHRLEHFVFCDGRSPETPKGRSFQRLAVDQWSNRDHATSQEVEMKGIGHQRSALESIEDLITSDLYAFSGHRIQTECASFIPGADRDSHPRMDAEIEEVSGYRGIISTFSLAYKHNFMCFSTGQARRERSVHAAVYAHLRSGADLEQRVKEIVASLDTKQCSRSHVVINASMSRGEDVFSLLSEEIVARILLAVMHSNLKLGDPHAMLQKDSRTESRFADSDSDPNRTPLIMGDAGNPHWIFGCQSAQSYSSMHKADGFVWLHRAIRPLSRRLRLAVDIIGQTPSLLDMPCAVALNGSVF